MMNPEAIARAAEAGPKPNPAPSTGPLPSSGGGLEAMAKSLEGVGGFLQAQGPKGQRAMAAFQALLTELAQLSQDETPEGPGQVPDNPEASTGRIHESMRPGVQVL